MIIVGVILSKKLNSGSKSEHTGYVICDNDKKETVIVKQGDNPFEHETLKPLEGKIVRAVGKFFNTKFVADQIDVIL